MKLRWILSTAISLILTRRATSLQQASVTTESLVSSEGYPFENHQVQTSDGYLLAVHRIPYSGRVDTPTPRPVVFLMHGFLASSSDFVVIGADKALAYLLSDAGYDVWMGNARGNRYSRNHVTRSPLSKEFWDFSWHEIGLIDISAMIEYVLSYTGEKQIHFVGHSQATTAFLVLNTINVNFKKNIKTAHFLAPVSFMNHIRSPIIRLIAPLVGQAQPLIEIFGNYEVLPNTKILELAGKVLCTDESPFQPICSGVLFVIGGYDPDNLNNTLLPLLLANGICGVSINQGLHYAQEILSGFFRQFDYGLVRNIATYGSRDPPSYPLAKYDVPTYMYYGENDFLTSIVDVERLMGELTNSSLKEGYKVPHPTFNHFAFVYGIHAAELVYKPLIDRMSSVN